MFEKAEHGRFSDCHNSQRAPDRLKVLNNILSLSTTEQEQRLALSEYYLKRSEYHLEESKNALSLSVFYLGLKNG